MPPPPYDIPARALLMDAPPVGPDALGRDIYALMVTRPELPCLAMVDHAGRPLGLFARSRVLMRIAKPFYRELFERRSARMLMEQNLLAIEADDTIDTLHRLIATHHPDALEHGFLILENGRYLGVGSPLELMAATVEQTRARLLVLEQAQALAEQANVGLDMALANDYDLILVDISMPEPDGIAFTRALRAAVMPS